jgi:hypothetical protein
MIRGGFGLEQLIQISDTTAGLLDKFTAQSFTVKLNYIRASLIREDKNGSVREAALIQICFLGIRWNMKPNTKTLFEDHANFTWFPFNQSVHIFYIAEYQCEIALTPRRLSRPGHR